MERRHMNEIREMLHRLRQGHWVREVARDLGYLRNTVRKYRDLAEQHGLLDVDRPLPEITELGALLGPPPAPRHMRSSVEPYSVLVKAWLDQNVEATAMWQRLRDEHGFTGSYSAVLRYVQRLRPAPVEPFCRIETAPGEEAQVDFGYAGLVWDAAAGRMRKVWAFVMTLSWSRHLFVCFVHDQQQETWLRCHEAAFEWFGGVARRIVIDNLKAAVIKPDLHEPVLGEPYRRLAQHYGCVISPNRPHTPRHKGKVESAVHYVKRNFLAGQQFADVAAMNARVRTWVTEIAGTRIHGTTKEAPLARFTQTEQAALMPLPEAPFELVSTRVAQVHSDSHVVVDGCYYSVPHAHIGKSVDVYVGRRRLEVYAGLEQVATHAVQQQPGQRVTRLEHYPQGKRAYLEQLPEHCLAAAAEIGPHCAEVVESLLCVERVYDRLRSVQALLRLAQTYGATRLDAACQRALHYGDITYRRVKRVLQADQDLQPLPPCQDSLPEAADAYQYARPAAAYFAEVAP